MASIFKKPSHKAQLPRNGHDLSHRMLFTSSVGQLLPVLSDFLDPGESIKINSNLFTRTQPLKTPAFVRLTEHIDYFFCPVKLINEYFGNFFYGIDDSPNPNNFISNNVRNPLKIPVVNYRSIVHAMTSKFDYERVEGDTSHVLAFSAGDDYYDDFGISDAANFLRLASLLGYSEKILSPFPANSNGKMYSGISVTLDKFAVYQRIFMDYYRNTDWTSNNPYSYSLTYFYKQGSYDSAVTNFFNGARGSSGDLLRLRYSPLKKDFFTNVYPSPLMSSINDINSYAQNISADDNPSLDDANTAILSSFGINLAYYISNPSASYNSMWGGIRSGEGNFNQNDTYVTDDTGNISATSLRTLFAYDRLKAITRRAKFHYDAQTLAHFGFSVPKGVSDEVYYLGSHSSNMSIGEIASTASTGTGENTSVLGELAGRGISSFVKQKSIKFTAPCHGYLMAIYRAVPDIDYAAYFVDKQNTNASPNMLYHPEFDRLGMQPLYVWQYYYLNQTVGSTNAAPTQDNTYIYTLPNFLAWTYRYIEYKVKNNTVHGAFNYTLQDWVSTRNGSWLQANGSSLKFSIDETYFYCPPTLFDNIFAVGFAGQNLKHGELSTPLVSYEYTGTNPSGDISLSTSNSISPVFQNDPLLHSIDFTYYKVSSKSTYGLPTL